MKNYADRNRRYLEFEEGQMVLVKLQPYRQLSVALRKKSETRIEIFWPFFHN